jgi:hypothetical protein
MKTVLNVGCGNKLAPSTADKIIINIDCVEPPDLSVVTVLESFQDAETAAKDKPLFLFDDATLLKYVPNEVADELHAYHLIEHFYPYQVGDILKRWKEVLKTGGVLALEQPDVVKCAINLLQLVTEGDGYVAFNLGLLGFYGAQDPEQPLMAHKYGWTAKTLSPVLFGAGFRGIQEYPARTHARERRDFRLEATKE